MFFFFSALVAFIVKIQCNPVTVPRQAINLTLSPRQATSQTVSCTVNADVAPMDTVTALTLYGSKAFGKAGEFESLATVDLWRPQARLLNGLGDKGVSAFGRIGTGVEKESKLEISWKTSRNGWPRRYKCLADGLDRNSLVVTISIIADNVVPNDQHSGLGDGDNHGPTRDPQGDISPQIGDSVETSRQNLTSTVDATHQTVESLAQLLEDQTSAIEQGQETMISLLKNLNLAHFSNSFDMSGVYEGKRYLISKAKATFNIQKTNTQCEIMGGYLVEIDDQKEFDFVFDFCKSLEGDNFFTGGNDIDEEGVWIYWHSKKPVEFSKWYQDQPNNFMGREHCMEIRTSFKATNDWDCHETGKFICEVYA